MVLNIVSGRVHESNVVVLSPAIGSFATRFVDTGVAVRIGNIDNLLSEIGDVFCIICNTIMTCQTVVEMSRRRHPVIWILHEWWDDDMIIESFKLRNIENLTLDTVKTALKEATMVVFVCDSQRQLYKPSANSDVIFVGVPDPFGSKQLSGDDTPSTRRSRSNTLNSSAELVIRSRSNTGDAPRYIPPPSPSIPSAPFVPSVPSSPSLGPGAGSCLNQENTFTFLCLGIVCPRKNQCWTVEVFKEWMKSVPEGKDARLVIVGARYTRTYEISYLDELKALIDGDVRIEVHDVTTDVDAFYQVADCVMIHSLNEVTPMVISEAFAWGIPVISTNIAGIKEMYVDGQEGYLLAPGDKEKAIYGMESLYSDTNLRTQMSKASRERFETFFDVELMVGHYRTLINKVAPPVILIDMDGTLVDWDAGFIAAWNKRSPLDRNLSYYMEDCVPVEYKHEAESLMNAEGFFLNLPPMEGALKAVQEMESEGGLNVFFCTSPLKLSMYCAQDKIDWILMHLGEEWLNKIIICQDKTEIRGDLLIDDKPAWNNLNSIWKHVVFDAPYNKHLEIPRLKTWADWRSVIPPLLGEAKTHEFKLAMKQAGVPLDLLAPHLSFDELSTDPEDVDGMRFFHNSKKLWKSFKGKVFSVSEQMMFRSYNSSRVDLDSLMPMPDLNRSTSNDDKSGSGV